MALKLGVLVFSGSGRAQEVLTGFQELHPTDNWTENIGVIERKKSGRVAIYGALGDSLGEEGAAPALGLGTGGLTGLLIGSLAGPVGLAVGGSLGAVFGTLLGAADEEDVDQPFFDIIRAKLDKDSSALVLLADEGLVDQFLAANRTVAREMHQQPVHA